MSFGIYAISFPNPPNRDNVMNSLTGDDAHYGFGGSLTADFPSQIMMDITEVCNLACTHCPHPDFAKSEHYGARMLDPDLNDKMVEEVKNHGQGLTKYIRYTGNGEPLTHPNGYDMIEHAVKNSGVYVTLTTNGKILNEKRTQRLLDAGVHLIDISIDAFKPETYANIRVKGNLETTRSNVQRLLKWVEESKCGTKVVVSFVEQPSNTGEIEDFKKFWNDQGADFVLIRRLHTHSGAVDNAAQQLHASAEEKRRPCLYPWERVSVSAAGALAFCPSDWVHGSYVADYSQTTIKETWQGEFYQKLRAAHLNNNFCDHGFCGQCPDWAATRWPHEGRSYADMIEDFKAEGASTE